MNLFDSVQSLQNPSSILGINPSSKQIRNDTVVRWFNLSDFSRYPAVVRYLLL